jgi:SAM-dependent methyltransferase/Flp pilus assembly protein TadD
MTARTPPSNGKATHIRDLLAEGLRQHRAGQREAAEKAYRSALALSPGHARALQLLGLVRHEQLDSAAAVDYLRQAVAADPSSADAHNDLAVVLLGKGDFADALSAAQASIRLNSASAPAHNNLGYCHERLGQMAAAQDAYLHAIKLAPAYGAPRANLARLLETTGHVSEAAINYAKALQIEDTGPARLGLIRCATRAHDLRTIPNLDRFLSKALQEVWARPIEAAHITLRLLQTSPAIADLLNGLTTHWPNRAPFEQVLQHPGAQELASSLLFHQALAAAPMADRRWEIVLTNIRLALLNLAASEGSVSPVLHEAMTPLAVALALQCHLNEYVYATVEGEEALAERLALHCAEQVAVGITAPSFASAVTACYRPLHTRDWASSLLPRSAFHVLSPLIHQQIIEPQDRRKIAPTIPAVTPIDATSAAVQEQYEENPYPFWTAVPKIAAVDVNVALTLMLGGARHKPLASSGGPLRVLIAGCGTGQQSSEAAMLYANAEVLAIDLSRASLSYAKQKAQHYKLSNITYGQGDILKASALNRQFDVIESTGVLHHMDDPIAGWRALRAVLAPGGVMRIALYSRLAREGLLRTGERLAAQGFDGSAKGIKDGRQTLILANSPDSAKILAADDFYTLSGCRDLLFHVRERQFSVPELSAAMSDLGLTFLGFHLPHHIHSVYRATYPDDPKGLDLGSWHAFERANPNLFGGMYQFYVQDRDA